MKSYPFAILAVVALLGTPACSDGPAPLASDEVRVPVQAQVSQQESDRYVVLFAAEHVPADFAARVSQLGGSVETSLDGIGVAAITGLTDAAAAELSTAADVRAVEPDVVMTLRDDDIGTAEAFADETVSEVLAPADATASPTEAQFYSRQWHLRAVFAPEAWAAGHLGSRDVVVAILDTGIDYLNPDLVG
ncbi:MAG TPA: hypothetical protein VGQ06_00285, partial [Gemmatimonadales bacterium]|nr:hypothetical protein [Gemmatimonadales bacterium]